MSTPITVAKTGYVYTYRICEQRRVRRACENAQSRQPLRRAQRRIGDGSSPIRD